MTCELTPYLTVRDARAAIAWYGEALGARLLGEAVVTDDQRIGHAEIDVAGARVYLADEYPELGLAAPGESRSVTLHLVVPDADAAVTRAADAGGRVERPPADSPHGRTGVVVDPFGHRWMLQSAPHDGFAESSTTPMVGVHGGQDSDLGAVPMYAVDDIEVAVAAVRTAGGQAEDVEQQSFGRSALCRDDQGLLFWVAQLG